MDEDDDGDDEDRPPMQPRQPKSDPVKALLIWTWLTAFGGCLLFAALTSVASLVGWLRDGRWPDMSIGLALWSLGIIPKSTGWVGLDQVILWFLLQHVAFGLLMAAGVLVAIVMLASRAFDNQNF